MKAVLCLILCIFSVAKPEQEVYNRNDIAVLMQIIEDNSDSFSSNESALKTMGWNNSDVAFWKHIIWNGDHPKRIEGLNLSGLGIAKLNIRGLDSLKHLDISNNRITSVSLPLSLEMLDVSKNQLESLSVESMSQLESLVADQNRIKAIRLPVFSKLRLLNVKDNQLKRLNVSMQSQLVSLNFGNNVIHSMDLSNNFHLRTIKGRNNYLKEMWMPSLLANSFPSLELRNCPKCKKLFPLLKLKKHGVQHQCPDHHRKNAEEMVSITNNIINFKMPKTSSQMVNKMGYNIYIF